MLISYYLIVFFLVALSIAKNSIDLAGLAACVAIAGMLWVLGVILIEEARARARRREMIGTRLSCSAIGEIERPIVHPNVASLLCLALVLSGCLGCDKPGPKPEPEPPTDPIKARYEISSSAVLAHLDEHGFLVSRWLADDRPEHIGDSLIWTGMALGVLPCDKVEPVILGLGRMVEQLEGGLYRHPTLPDKISLDGALGFYWGVARHLQRCPASQSALEYIVRAHQLFSEPRGRLNPDADLKLLPGFTYVRDLVVARVTGGAAPDGRRLSGLETQVAAWALAVQTSRSSCFRVHLGLLSLQAVEAAGGSISAQGRAGFCGATVGMDLPTVDHWCGRGDLPAWIASFKPNEWEYRHQRCGAWETPDGKPGLSTPGLDELVALTQVYTL